MEGERENAKESTGKEEKTQLRKQEKKNGAPQEREKKEEKTQLRKQEKKNAAPQEREKEERECST